MRVDLAQPDAAARLIAEAGDVDVLVNNVGTAYIASFEQLSDDEWDEMWQLNVMSYVRAIRAVLPVLRERGGGSIVNVSSTAGKRPSTGMPHYSVTKAAVLSLSRLVADLYAKDRIRCNAVAPGPTATEAWLGEGGLAEQQGDRDEVLARVAAGRPIGRRGLERRRRHRPHHHLAWERGDRRTRIRGTNPRARGAVAVAARRPLLRDARTPEAGGAVRRAHAVPARPRPDRPLEAVPPPQGQDAGVHRPGGRPLPDADDPHARDHRDLARRRSRAAAQRGSDGGDRPRARHGPSALRPRGRGGARPRARSRNS